MKDRPFSYNDIQAAIENAEQAVSMRELRESHGILLKIVKQQQKTIDDLLGAKE